MIYPYVVSLLDMDRLSSCYRKLKDPLYVYMLEHSHSRNELSVKSFLHNQDQNLVLKFVKLQSFPCLFPLSSDQSVSGHACQ